MKKIIFLFIGCLFLMGLVGCGNVVPPGTTVIVLKPKGKAIIKNEGLYRAWGRDKLYFIDTKLKSFPKKLQILCADEINMLVDVKWIGSFKISEQSIDIIKKKVPAQKTVREDMKGFELSLERFFSTTMADILSSVTRETVST